MNSIFKEYSGYYDLLYKDKDYSGESAYVDQLIQEYRAGAKTILDLGCGTGNHDFVMAEKGYEVTGTDLSEDMIWLANEKLEKCLSTGRNLPLHFQRGDMTSLRTGIQFDAVISLFHAVCYLVQIDDLKKAFFTAREHLHTGGLFIFDIWYGPGVIADPPGIRKKQWEDDQISVTRISHPDHFVNENIVDVHFDINIKEKKTGEESNIKELHKIRYFFNPELQELFKVTGFKCLDFFEWMTFEKPNINTWNAVYVLQLT